MLHAPEWITAWRLKKAYSLSKADVLSLVELTADQGLASLHPAWATFKANFVLPQDEKLPAHWQMVTAGLYEWNDDEPWFKRVWFGERLLIFSKLQLISVNVKSQKLKLAIRILLNEIYDDELIITVDEFCEPFIVTCSKNAEHIFSQVFLDSILFNKRAAIRALVKANYPLILEVKGITRELIKQVNSGGSDTVSEPDHHANPSPASYSKITSTEPCKLDEISSFHVKQWSEILPNLNGSRLSAAKLAIEKWRGNSHLEAYRKAFPDGCANNPKSFVSNKQAVAREIAQTYQLTMPDWNAGAR